MMQELRDKVCIVGVGESAYGKRGTLAAQGSQRLAVDAIRAACADAGISTSQVGGFSSFMGDPVNSPSNLAPALGIRQWSYGSMVWGGGGSGLPTAVLNAAMAVAAGVCEYAVVVRSIVQDSFRMGSSSVDRSPAGGVLPPSSYTVPFGMVIPPALYAMRAARHMAIYGTTEEHLGEVAIVQREYASRNPLAIYRTPMTMDDHHSSRIIAHPLRLLDCCMESDGAAALVLATADQAKDLRQPPVYISGISTITEDRWVGPLSYTESEEMLASSGHRAAAQQLYAMAGIGPDEIDLGLFYDGTTVGVLLCLEDWGFVGRGEAGSFVADGQTRLGGRLPVNTHGGNLSESYMQGASHLVEGVRQLRGLSHNQVGDASVALYASGLGYPPMGGVMIRR